jgi:hypothetical protein
MTEVLQQINITYHPNQDRLLLRARTGANSELRVWLTRRYANLLLQVLCTRMDKAGGIQNLSSDRGTLERFRQGAFDQQYKVESIRAYPLGEEGVLGFRVNVQDAGAGVTSLQLSPEHGQGLVLNLDPSMLYLIFNLLEQAILQADWCLPSVSSHKAAIH